jgi:hypothetical protein
MRRAREAERDQASHRPESVPRQRSGTPRRKRLFHQREEQGRTGNEDAKDQGCEDDPWDRPARRSQDGAPAFCDAIHCSIKSSLRHDSRENPSHSLGVATEPPHVESTQISQLLTHQFTAKNGSAWRQPLRSPTSPMS